MKRSLRNALIATPVAALGAAALALAPSAAGQPAPIEVELLTPRAVFTDAVSGQIRIKHDGQATHPVTMSDLSRTAVARITVQPGAKFPWHTHPGPVIVNVTSGELTYVKASDCVARPYPAGTAFVDPGHGHVHSAVNRSADVVVLYATFLQVTASGPLTVTNGVQPPADCEL